MCRFVPLILFTILPSAAARAGGYNRDYNCQVWGLEGAKWRTVEKLNDPIDLGAGKTLNVTFWNYDKGATDTDGEGSAKGRFSKPTRPR
jgi:hypothetical protein